MLWPACVFRSISLSCHAVPHGQSSCQCRAERGRIIPGPPPSWRSGSQNHCASGLGRAFLKIRFKSLSLSWCAIVGSQIFILTFPPLYHSSVTHIHSPPWVLLVCTTRGVRPYMASSQQQLQKSSLMGPPRARPCPGVQCQAHMCLAGSTKFLFIFCPDSVVPSQDHILDSSLHFYFLPARFANPPSRQSYLNLHPTFQQERTPGRWNGTRVKREEKGEALFEADLHFNDIRAPHPTAPCVSSWI